MHRCNSLYMNVSSFTQLKSALSSGQDIKLTKDIPILEPITISPGRFIEFGNYKFLSRGKSIMFNGAFEAFRRQYFSGFGPGDIKGTFSSSEVFPEWWGLTPQRNEIAINCAIQSFQLANCGHKVSLASGYYYVSGPIDLRASLSYLVGACSGGTFIVATELWTADFEDAMFWTDYISVEPKCHAALVWIGSKEPANQSFRTGVKGVTINAFNAAIKYPDKKISCISSTGYVEENSIIEDVCLNGFSGFGIGFTNKFGVSTTNGLSIRNFWITGSISKHAVGIHIPPHSGVASIRDGTLDLRISEGSAKNGITWPTYGMVVGGAHTTIDNIHIEGCGVGIFVQSTDAPCSVSISNISTQKLMDYGMEFADEDIPLIPAPSIDEQKLLYPGADDPYYHKYSSAIIIGRVAKYYNSSKAFSVTAITSNIRNHGRCKYLIRDGLYDKHISPFGMGQYPNSGNGSITFYARKEGFVSQDSSNFPFGGGDMNFRNKFFSNETGFTSHLV